MMTDGFTCIANHIKSFYPGQEGLYYGTLIPGYLGGNDPLDGVEIWKSDKGCPHWLYVTYGFTDLYPDEDDDDNDPDHDDPDVDDSADGDGGDLVSGYGFELTFRLARGSEDEPPVWPVNLLQNLARYVFSSGNTFDSGHYLNANGPIALETDTRLTCLGFLTDPELGRIDTLNGSMVFLEAIGITEDELNGMMCWSGESFLLELCRHVPYGISDLSRTSLMDQPDFRRAWEQGMARDGSSTGMLYLSELSGTLEGGSGCLQFGAGHVDQILTLLRARIGKDRPLILQCGETVVCFKHAQQAAAVMEDQTLVISLTQAGLDEICLLLKPHVGVYHMKTMALTVRIVPTHIRDNDGTITQTIE